MPAHVGAPVRSPEAELREHRYNDDLLLEERSREYARKEFPLVFFALDNPELRAAFARVDKKANAAKRRSQQAGVWAAILAMLSLMAAAAEPLWRGLPWLWAVVIAIGAAGFGISAVLVAAFGLLHGAQKDQWLYHRLCGERLRQLHFQVFIWKLDDIVRLCKHRDNRHLGEFVDQRRRTVEAFVHRLTGHADSELSAVLAPTGGSKLWLYDRQTLPVVPPDPDTGRCLVLIGVCAFRNSLVTPSTSSGPSASLPS